MTLSLKAGPATATNAMRRELRLVSGLFGGETVRQILRLILCSINIFFYLLMRIPQNIP